MKNEVMRLDVSIGVCLLEKNEQDKLKNRLEKVHANIPQAMVVPSH